MLNVLLVPSWVGIMPPISVVATSGQPEFRETIHWPKHGAIVVPPLAYLASPLESLLSYLKTSINHSQIYITKTTRQNDLICTLKVGHCGSCLGRVAGLLNRNICGESLPYSDLYTRFFPPSYPRFYWQILFVMAPTTTLHIIPHQTPNGSQRLLICSGRCAERANLWNIVTCFRRQPVCGE